MTLVLLPPKASSCWREMWGWLWLERHAISQSAYLRLLFPYTLAALGHMWPGILPRKRGAQNSVSIQGEPCCPGMGKYYTIEPLGQMAFHICHLQSPVRWLLP